MPQVTFAGHPLHPQLIVVPAGLLPFSLVLDVLHAKTRDHSYFDAAYYALMGGFIGGILAGAAGAMDYRTIPSDSPAKKLGKLHGLLNVGLLFLTRVNLLLRRRGGRSRSSLPMAISAVTTMGLFVSAWYGGHLVYHYGMRVSGTELSGASDEVRMPGDEGPAQTLATTAGEEAA